MYVWTLCLPGVHEGQKKALGPLELELHTDVCEPPCGFWESNPGPWEEQPLSHLSIPASTCSLIQRNHLNLIWLFTESMNFFSLFFLHWKQTDPFLIAIVPGTVWLLRCLVSSFTVSSWDLLSEPPASFFIVASFCFIFKTLLWLVFSPTVLPSKTKSFLLCSGVDTFACVFKFFPKYLLSHCHKHLCFS